MAYNESYNVLIIQEKKLVMDTKVKVTDAFKFDFCPKNAFFTDKSSDCDSILYMLLTELIFSTKGRPICGTYAPTKHFLIRDL